MKWRKLTLTIAQNNNFTMLLLVTQQTIEKDGAVVQALRAKRQAILDNIRDNDELGIRYQMEIELNEKRRCQLQDI